MRPLLVGGSMLAAAALIHSIISWFAGRRRPDLEEPSDGYMPPVTMLKPLHGAEPETYGCLISFCDQQYREFQIIFGVANANDPAVAIVRRLQHERPHVDIQLSIDRRQHGSNRKVSNLLNMMALPRHDVLVLSDGDVRVNPDYLAKVVSPLSDDRVGVVTCTYRGCPRSGFWPLMGSMFINDWFAPSVRLAALSGSRAFAFGATIALRREALSIIGGFKSIANQLADDYRLGELTRRAGLRTVLSDVVVDTVVSDTTLKQLVQHELRWLRTIRAMNPLGHRFLFLTFSLPMAALGNWLAANSLITMELLFATVVIRILAYTRNCRTSEYSASVLLIPVRDMLSLGLWGWSFVTRRVQWRDSHFDIANDGSIQIIEST